jgi:hypothetical protein
MRGRDNQILPTQPHKSTNVNVAPIWHPSIHPNFIVRWGSRIEVDAPIVEAVMIGVADGQAISFVSPSREITE